MSKFRHDPDEYKRKLIELLELHKAKSKRNTAAQPIVDESPKQKSIIRQATPHPKKSRCKSAFRTFENRVGFDKSYDDDDSNDDDVLKNNEHNKRLNVEAKMKHKRKKQPSFDNTTDDNYSSPLNTSREDEEALRKNKKNKRVKIAKFDVTPSTNDLYDSDDEPKPSSSKLSRRKATPHQKNYKHKLTVNNLEDRESFSNSDDDNSHVDVNERNKDKKKLVKFSDDCVVDNNSDDDNNEFLLDNSSSERLNKKTKIDNNKTRRKSNERNEKILKRQVTPYHNSNKLKLKADNESSALLNRNLEYEFDDSDNFEVAPVELDDLQVSTSEIPKLLMEKKQENVPKVNKRKPKAATFIDVGDIICDNNNEENLRSFDNSFMRNDSDIETIDESEVLDITSDCSGAIVCGIENDQIKNKENAISELEDLEYEKQTEPTSVEPENADNENSEEDNFDEISKSISDNEEDLVFNEPHSIISVEDAPSGNYQYISLNDVLLFALHENTKLYFYGLMSVTVLQGEVQVFGYTLTPSLKDVELYSPRGSSFLFFETKHFTSPIRPDLFHILCELQMEKEDAEEFCSRLLPSSTVILCKKIVKNHIEFLQKHISQQIFPKCEYRIPQCVFQNVIGNWNVVKIPNKWNELIDSMKPSSKTFLCGGKSVGKSTMLRYLVNKLLMKYSEVLVVDLDPGQPEFTIPGCISATVIKEPIFGPNYTHLKKPIRCLFLPHINVAYEPDTYLTAVRELMRSCDFYCKGPILINYVGFTRGIGLEIFATAVVLVQPNTIIEIYDANKSRNFREVISHQSMVAKSKLLANSINALPKFESYRIESAADCSQGWHLEPRQIREMCVLSYLGGMLPKGVLSLTATKVPMLVVDLSLVKLIHDGKIVLPCIVNANLVALCSSNDIYSSYTCHGWGVVRAVNLSKNELYLLTTLPPKELQNATNLILGSVTLPPSLYMTADNNTGLIPYMSQSVPVTLGRIPKRSRLPAKITQGN
ncbi:hypothetical protein ILUMI_00792 [Ignelater luminosus]|uniref:Polynucleotide 5'-hydroxyl-kinase NOL9 n=1 Tax=Ignelater luminosus TaxID=2038154 RepID=A0A8K0DJP8_IGNLU|nr:hypothetical protein ILUMI_00792 [Ignelater luminosus]